MGLSKKKGQLFYYRLEPSKLLSALIQMDENERGVWVTQFAIDLQNGIAHSDLAEEMINEAKSYSETKKAAITKRWEAKQKDTSEYTCIQVNTPEPVCNTSNSNSNSKQSIPYDEIINDLNLKGGFRFKTGTATQKHINGRFAEGFTKEDFFHVHTVMIGEWKDDPKMCKYLRPETLYNSEKFQGYLNRKIPESKCVTPEWF